MGERRGEMGKKACFHVLCLWLVGWGDGRNRSCHVLSIKGGNGGI